MTCAALLFALVATLSGLDRYSENQPGAVRLVPAPFRSDAWRVASAQAFAAGDAELASTYARSAIDADPLDPRGSSLLATALLAEGKREAAGGAFTMADRLGLRTPIVQAYFFDVALASGNARVAARRLDILLLAHPSMTSIDYFFSALEAHEGGKVELARRLMGDPEWAAAYLSAFRSPDAVLRNRARFLVEHTRLAPLGCTRIEPMLFELERRNLRADAMRLARRQCPSRALVSIIADPGFETIGAENAFGWRRHGSGDVRLTTVGDDDKAIEIENRAGTTRLVISQPVALEAGEYRLFASVSGTRTDSLIASLDCGQPTRPSTQGGSLGRGQLLWAHGCENMMLGIWARPASGTVRLDNLRISQVGQVGD